MIFKNKIKNACVHTLVSVMKQQKLVTLGLNDSVFYKLCVKLARPDKTLIRAVRNVMPDTVNKQS